MTDGPGIDQVSLATGLRERILAEAEASRPLEACGLLIGAVRESHCTVERSERSANLAADGRCAFEIDPKLQFRLLHGLRGTESDVVGVYHSHPAGAPEPSATDARRALEAGFVWIIAGRGALRAYVALGEGKGFRPVALCA